MKFEFAKPSSPRRRFLPPGSCWPVSLGLGAAWGPCCREHLKVTAEGSIAPRAQPGHLPACARASSPGGASSGRGRGEGGGQSLPRGRRGASEQMPEALGQAQHLTALRDGGLRKAICPLSLLHSSNLMATVTITGCGQWARHPAKAVTCCPAPAGCREVGTRVCSLGLGFPHPGPDSAHWPPTPVREAGLGGCRAVRGAAPGAPLTLYLSTSLKPRMCCSFRRQMGQRSRGRRRASSRLSAPCMRQRSQRQLPRPRRWQSSWHVT